jgi:uncharacterized protein (DUF2235 family)
MPKKLILCLDGTSNQYKKDNTNVVKLVAMLFDGKSVSTLLPAQNSKVYAAPNSAATIHESLRGFWHIVEWTPKRIKDPQKDFASRWILPRGRARWVSPNAKLHPSLQARRQAVSDYKPSNIP